MEENKYLITLEDTYVIDAITGQEVNDVSKKIQLEVSEEIIIFLNNFTDYVIIPGYGDKMVYKLKPTRFSVNYKNDNNKS